MSHEHQQKATHHPLSVQRKAQLPPEQKLEALIEIVDQQTSDFERRLDSGERLTDLEIDTARHALERERGELQEQLLLLPAGSPALVQAFHASDRLTRLLGRFDAFERAGAARSAVAADSAHERVDDVLSDVDEAVPSGYCDAAPQHVDPCQLDPVSRDRYRRRISDDIHSATSNWVSAIDSKAIAQRFKTGEIPFEAKLGELIFDSLFSVIGLAVRFAAHKGVDRGVESLATKAELPNVPGAFTERIAPADVARAKSASDTIVAAGMGAEKSRLTGQKHTSAQLAMAAAGTVRIPVDEIGFIDALRKVPQEWSKNILINVDSLFDPDLAALVLGLERAERAMSVEAFGDRLDDALQRFADQVTVQDQRADIVVIGVGMRDGTVRHALAEPERVASSRFRADEFGFATVKTGNWRFVRWIDDDLQSVALEHARANDWSAGATVEAFDDGQFREGRVFNLLSARRP